MILITSIYIVMYTSDVAKSKGKFCEGPMTVLSGTNAVNTK
jgi:hypothetical protein